MTDRMPSNGGPTMTAGREERPVDGSSHAVHTDDIANRFEEARDDREPERSGPAAASTDEGRARARAQTMPLVADEQAYRKRWTQVQAGFVDEPRRAVEHADALVADVIKELVDRFAAERGRLEAQWSQGQQASTEDLRVALQRYRSFFDRLLVA